MKIYLRNILFLLLFAVLVPTGLCSVSAQDGKGLKLSTVVIDAGHGGKDAGCISKDRKTYEKNLALSIAKQFGQKIKDAYPDVRVIYTRTTDKYLTLNERADIANRNKADLFVSVHINAVPQTSPNGFSVYVLSSSNSRGTDMFSANMDVCKRENSVIMLEEDYTTKYQGFDPNDPESFIFFNLMQNAHFEQSLLFASEIDRKFANGPFRQNKGIYQGAFYVLWKTTMPAVLVEAGFISNAEDLKVMRSETGQGQIAQRLFEAFREYKKKYDGSLDYGRMQGDMPVQPDPVPEKEEASPAQERQGTVYGVQILLLSRRLQDGDKALKGYNAQVFRDGNRYKYIIGVDGDCESVRKLHRKARQDFPDSFIVKIEDGEVSRL